MADDLVFTPLGNPIRDRNEKPVPLMSVTGGPAGAVAFIYQCILNLDVDGAPNTYGLNNPRGLNTLNDPNLQVNLDPKDFLGNACGDPGDGSSGHKNFDAGGHNFYWSSLVSIQKKDASARLVIDERREVEASRGVDDHGNVTEQQPEGSGYFPVVQLNAPFRGYYISTTATWTDGSLPDTNPSKWVNGLTVPYAVRTGAWDKLMVKGRSLQSGDYGLAINNATGRHCGFFFGDAAGGSKVGESSGGLFKALGNDETQAVSFIVFPGSGSGREMGKNPEGKIRSMVLPLMLDLCVAKNALELPSRLAFGPDMVIPKKQAEMTDSQSSAYNNIMRALRFWGIWPT